MAFRYSRVVRFHETDAAGVLYFSNLLTLCHEAYEAAIASAGIDLGQFFSRTGAVAVPIVHAEVDFYQPLICGDKLAITLVPQQLTPYSFEISYKIQAQATDKLAGKALTRHVCISVGDRRRHSLTAELLDWIQVINEPATLAD
ncbi:MAG: acyl-CoA thioesterase [Phormidesmis sp.]